MSKINKELVNAIMAKHYEHDWRWHALQVVRGCYATYCDREGTEHRIDGSDPRLMIDIAELRAALAAMQPRQQLFEIIKEEMQARGHWKNLPRGKSMAKGHDERRK